MKLKLLKPIQHGGDLIAELEFSEPTAKEMRGLPLEPKQGDLLDLAGALCKQPPSVMNKLCVKDYMKVLEVVSVFMVGGLETGESA
jgi:hypothetical protein